MAGKKAAGGAKRKAKYVSAPTRTINNKRQRMIKYTAFLEAKLRQLESRTVRRLISKEQAENQAKGIRKELAFVAGEAERPKFKTGREGRLLHEKNTKRAA